jgi:DNA ligase-1
VTKICTGFSDKNLSALAIRLAPHGTAHRPVRVEARITPDVWFEPALVIEIIAA